MKIIILCRSLCAGGAERQLVELAKGLRSGGNDVMVVLFYGGGELEGELQAADVNIMTLNKRGRWDAYANIVRLARIIKHFRPDILHGYMPSANIVSVIMKLFCSKLKVVWGVRSSYMDLSHYDLTARILYKLEPKLSHFADTVIVNSHAGYKHAVKSGYHAKKLVVIQNGIDTESFCPNREAGKRVRAELGVNDDEILIGIVARFDPLKDHELFLRAASLVSMKRPDARYVCIGDGPAEYRDMLKERAKELGVSHAVIWAGARNDMSDIYNAIDLVVNASYCEGFSNVIGEAMSCGVPCVVTDVGDSAEIVGDCGYVVPPKDPERLTDAIMRILSLQLGGLREMGLRGRERMVSCFSTPRMLERTTAILEEIS